jgi:hypothetical protein
MRFHPPASSKDVTPRRRRGWAYLPTSLDFVSRLHRSLMSVNAIALDTYAFRWKGGLGPLGCRRSRAAQGGWGCLCGASRPQKHLGEGLPMACRLMRKRLPRESPRRSPFLREAFALPHSEPSLPRLERRATRSAPSGWRWESPGTHPGPPGTRSRGAESSPGRAETNSRSRQRFGGDTERDGDGRLPEGGTAIWMAKAAIAMATTPIQVAETALAKGTLPSRSG